jgi:heme oxygenase
MAQLTSLPVTSLPVTSLPVTASPVTAAGLAPRWTSTLEWPSAPPHVGAGERPPLHPRWPPLLAELRRTTRPDHARVAAYLRSGRRPLGWLEYREFLAIHHGWIAALDFRLRDAASVYGLPFSGRRLPALDRDLFMLAVPAWSATARASLPPLRSRAEALGCLYVYEGFRLGCRVLARRVRHLGLGPENGGALLEGVGAGARTTWLHLVDALARVPPAEHAAVVEAAADLFRRWQEWLLPHQRRVAAFSGAGGAR